MTQTAVASIPCREQRIHLTDRQQHVLRALLAERLQVHHHRAAQAAAALDDFTSNDSPHEREIVRDALQSLLGGIRDHEYALRRFDAGTYGACSVCARPIAFERLEAIPEVNHCVRCVRPG